MCSSTESLDSASPSHWASSRGQRSSSSRAGHHTRLSCCSYRPVSSSARPSQQTQARMSRLAASLSNLGGGKLGTLHRLLHVALGNQRVHVRLGDLLALSLALL